MTATAKGRRVQKSFQQPLLKVNNAPHIARTHEMWEKGESTVCLSDDRFDPSIFISSWGRLHP